MFLRPLGVVVAIIGTIFTIVGLYLFLDRLGMLTKVQEIWCNTWQSIQGFVAGTGVIQTAGDLLLPFFSTLAGILLIALSLRMLKK